MRMFCHMGNSYCQRDPPFGGSTLLADRKLQSGSHLEVYKYSQLYRSSKLLFKEWCRNYIRRNQMDIPNTWCYSRTFLQDNWIRWRLSYLRKFLGLLTYILSCSKCRRRTRRGCRTNMLCSLRDKQYNMRRCWPNCVHRKGSGRRKYR